MYAGMQHSPAAPPSPRSVANASQHAPLPCSRSGGGGQEIGGEWGRTLGGRSEWTYTSVKSLSPAWLMYPSMQCTQALPTTNLPSILGLHEAPHVQPVLHQGPCLDSRKGGATIGGGGLLLGRSFKEKLLLGVDLQGRHSIGNGASRRSSCWEEALKEKLVSGAGLQGRATIRKEGSEGLLWVEFQRGTTPEGWGSKEGLLLGTELQEGLCIGGRAPRRDQYWGRDLKKGMRV